MAMPGEQKGWVQQLGPLVSQAPDNFAFFPETDF